MTNMCFSVVIFIVVNTLVVHMVLLDLRMIWLDDMYGTKDIHED
jgi:hypothetical protein